MITLSIRTFRWSIENARSVGVAAAFVSLLYLRAVNNPPRDAFEALAVVLPALEVSMFAAFLSIYRDSIRAASGGMRELGAFAFWFVTCFAIMWLNVIFVRAGIDAYVRLGVPPAITFAP